jgi:PAS domain S-box-containing protein
MNFQGAIRNLAGQSSIYAILLLVLGIAIAGAPQLQQKRTAAVRIGSEMAISKAEAVADALLAHRIDGKTLDTLGTYYRAHHFPAGSQANGSEHNPLLDSRAVAKLRADPSHAAVQFEAVGKDRVLHYAVPDGNGGVLLIEMSLDREFETVGRYFGQSYLAGSAFSYLLVGLLVFAVFGMRLFLRALAQLPPEDRRSVIEKGLHDTVEQRRNLLPWLLLLCAAVFAIDLKDWMESVVGIGYIIAVTLSLSSNRYWHSTAVAGVGALFLFVAPLIAPANIEWWLYLQNHAVTMFAIIVTGLFGSVHLRKTRAEALALAEATRSRLETTELREALTRAEAAETELRDAESRLERASVSSLEGHWETYIDQPGAKCWFSSSYATLTGYDPSYLATLDADGAAALTHPDDIGRQRAAIGEHLEAGKSYDVPIRLLMANGEYRWFQLRGAMQRDPNGAPIRAAGSIRDIHQQKLSEDLLREAQQRFERAVSGTQDALFDSDLSTGEMWRSPRYYEMLGYRPDELGDARHSVGALIHPDDAATIGNVAAAHLQHDTPYDVEYRMRHKNGNWIWMRERAKAERDATGKPIRLAGSIHDITEQRLARDALVQATEEAEAASNAKSTFLATMSHEIRTPMNGVIGMTGLLLDTGLDRVQRDYAETIRASADSLLTILNDILDFSKIEAGKLDIETIDLDLGTNVDDVGSIMAFQAAAKGLELVVNVRPEVPDRVMGDPQRIRQCLLNLVGNAIKFTTQGEVVLEVCSLGQQSGRSLVHFEVRDTGIGIPPDAIQKLFQPFTQADSSTTRKFGGTGLGLSIVRKLVEMMGGQAGAQSEPGKGSTFWFTLPLEPVVTAEDKSTASSGPRGKRVLLVDDNETNRRVLSSQMLHFGYDVEVSESADAAMAILRSQQTPFDVVVLDYHMPEMDGAMLGENIMNSKEIGPTRLVLLTSLDRSGDMQRFADIGFSAYLTKPVRTRELLDCLARTLSINAQDWHLRSQPIITRGTLIASETRRQYSGRVLLVEDNAINQRVARRFLERLGCEVEVVGDGAQAVAAFQRQRFGFILMDMQMPVMDGIEATRRIRELEIGHRRTPIVALTANAMMGTLERCLEAGMDDYLTKPLDITRLQDVLDRFFAPATDANTELFTEPSTEPSATAASSHSTDTDRQTTPMTELDTAIRARLADIAGDDTEFVGELINAFIMGSEESIREMHQGIVAKDRGALGRAAHKLKGASSNLHIDALAVMAGDVETAAKAGKDEGMTKAVEAIVTEFQRVAQAMRAELDRPASKRAANG